MGLGWVDAGESFEGLFRGILLWVLVGSVHGDLSMGLFGEFCCGFWVGLGNGNPRERIYLGFFGSNYKVHHLCL